jgi:Cytochrome P460
MATTRVTKSMTGALGAVAGGLAIAATVWAYAAAQAPATVPYPDGYRDWTHVKSMVIQQGHPLFDAFGGVHHIYANDAALKTLKTGGIAFPDGAVFIFDLLAATGNAQAIAEGPRKVVGVMHRDAKRFAATGGWGFEGFKGDTRDRALTDGGAGCFQCHKDQAATTGFVFTKWRQ